MGIGKFCCSLSWEHTPELAPCGGCAYIECVFEKGKSLRHNIAFQEGKAGSVNNQRFGGI